MLATHAGIPSTAYCIHPLSVQCGIGPSMPSRKIANTCSVDDCHGLMRLRLDPPHRRPRWLGDCTLTSVQPRTSSRLGITFDGSDGDDKSGRAAATAAGAAASTHPVAPRKRGRPKGSKLKKEEQQGTSGIKAIVPFQSETGEGSATSAAGLDESSGSTPATAVRRKRGRPKGSKSKKNMEAPKASANRKAPPPATVAAAAENTSRNTDNANRPPRRISIARAATAANREAAATEAKAVAKARTEAAGTVAAAAAAAAASTAAAAPGGAVSNSVMLTGKAFFDETGERSIDDDDLTAAAVAAMKRGTGRRRRSRPSTDKPGTPRLSQDRAGMGADPSLRSEQQQRDEEENDTIPNLSRAEVDAILSDAALGAGGAGNGGAGVDDRRSSGGGGLDPPVALASADAAGAGADSVAASRHKANDAEAEEAGLLRALMRDIGFTDEELAAYSFEELLLLQDVSAVWQPLY